MRLLFFLIILFSIQFSKAQTFDLNSDTIKVGDIFNPDPPIYFDFDKETIRPESYAFLDSVAVFLSLHDSLIIEVGTHMDSRWSDEYSNRLDLDRSKSVVEYLINKGIIVDRLFAKGYGRERPIYTESEEEAMRRRNRRTEFKVLEIRN
ncbi:MAG: hypothetical protein C0592_02085 [Marinilabiliales bacterium]|nr:MAG: hypothetical protein C0592_02085 [Marinilabiliales bacterium]